jgi:hypothetical protein
MILELVEFNSPKGWSRAQVADEARNTIPKWRANKQLLRKHFLLELNGKTGWRRLYLAFGRGCAKGS